MAIIGPEVGMAAAASPQRGTTLSKMDGFLIGALVVWSAWVLGSPWWSGRTVPLTSSYLVAPLLLLLGVLLGRKLALVRRRWRVLGLLAVGAVALLLAPLYANAKGAVGVQLVALVALILLAETSRTEPRRETARRYALATAVGAMAILLASGSDAASTLVVLLAVGFALVLGSRSAPPKKYTIGIAALMLSWASLAVVWLGSLAAWPDWLNSDSSLSSARHTLWGDALALWRAHPITGAGPGSFTGSSELASSNPALATVHSSVLQVGSELGFIGVALFAALVASGLVLAVRGSRPAGLIAAAAWTCLGIHALIDHLWEFPVVTLAAGLVLGWSSSSVSRRSGCPTQGSK